MIGHVAKVICFLCVFCVSSSGYAVDEAPVATPVLLIGGLFLLAMAPFFLMMMTSFVKIAVVLSLIRQALGTQQIPPNQIITGLAMILSIYIMSPVGTEIYDRMEGTLEKSQSTGSLLSQASLETVKKVVDAAKDPVRQFLKRHADEGERKVFYNLALRMRPAARHGDIMPDDFLILVPSFMVSEIAEAFQIGFIIFLPFLVVDMVVSNILLAMGMFMVSPITIALPFKLLLFVLVDGWSLISKGLVMGYTN